jgi:hypothetical protein
MKRIYLLLALICSLLSFSQNFHDTQGKLEVANSGQATYTLPIAMPPSIQDVGPVINLVYASGQMGGIVGQGWNISTISAITRISTRLDIDGFIDGVDFDSNDMLALDGQRLLTTSGTYWADGSTYQTEVLSNTKIQLIGSGTAMYFIVTAPDGSRSWYGNYGGMNATDNTAYYITRYEDKYGNFITYHYTNPYTKSLCISEIKFSANSNGLLTPLNSIFFQYKLAKRSEKGYVKGVLQEKVALLDYVLVKTNNLIFRKYQINHLLDNQLGYERVSQIQESNNAGELANPIIFDYKTTQTLSTQLESEYWVPYTNEINFNNIYLSGDFDGDERLDFVTDIGLYKKLFDVNNPQSPISTSVLNYYGSWPIATLKDNKLIQKQSILNMDLPQLNQLTFKSYNLDNATNSILEYNYLKTIDFPNSASCWSNCPNSPCVAPSYLKTSNKYLTVDFNGDGISELLLIGYPEQKTLTASTLKGEDTSRIPDPNENCLETITIGTAPNVIRILDLNPNSSTVLGSKGYVNLDFTTMAIYGKFFVVDFNGDGKSDVLSIRDDKSYSITGFKQLNAAPWVQMELLGQGIIDEYSDTKQMLFGDFNGDGKTDIILPDTEGGSGSAHTLWHIYYSNPKPLGGEFFVKESHTIVEYRPNSGSDYVTQVHVSNYYALDTNGDGKSDIVRIWRRQFDKPLSINDKNTEWNVKTYVNNIGNTSVIGDKFTLDYSSTYDHENESPALVIPIVSTYQQNGQDKELILVNNHLNQIWYINFTKDVSEDIRLTKVTASGGNIVDEILYKKMEPSYLNNAGLGSLYDFYSSLNTVNYPFVEVKRLSTNFIVSKLTNTVEGIVKYQDFRYNGLVVNMNGLGNIGFNKTEYLVSNPNFKKTLEC